MLPTSNTRQWRRRATFGASVVALLSIAFATSSQSAGVDAVADNQKTATPIKHVIVLIGENRSFDHVFATYVPKSEDSVSNLLSKGIINADGSSGPHFGRRRNFRRYRPSRTSSTSA
jgi:phospholipase C